MNGAGAYIDYKWSERYNNMKTIREMRLALVKASMLTYRKLPIKYPAK